jgi:hypothetical protein
MKKDFLEKIKNRSDAEKRIIAFNVAFLITLFIGIIWFTTTFYVLDGGFGSNQTANSSSSIDYSEIDPFVVTDGYVGPFESIKESFSELFNAF